MIDNGSPNALTASSKLTPCFFQLPDSFLGSHEKTSAMTRQAVASPRTVSHHAASAVIQIRLNSLRQDRGFKGDDANWKPYGDIFLAMEGLGTYSSRYVVQSLHFIFAAIYRPERFSQYPHYEQ